MSFLKSFTQRDGQSVFQNYPAYSFKVYISTIPKDIQSFSASAFILFVFK